MNNKPLLEQIKAFQEKLNKDLVDATKNQPASFPLRSEVLKKNVSQFLLDFELTVVSNSDTEGKVLGRDISLLKAIFLGYKKSNGKEPNIFQSILMGNPEESVALIDEPEVLTALVNPTIELTRGLHSAIAAHPKTPPETLNLIALSGGAPSVKTGSFCLEILARRDDLPLEAALLCAEDHNSRKLLVGSKSKNFDLPCLFQVVEVNTNGEPPPSLDEMVELYRDVRAYSLVKNLVSLVGHCQDMGKDIERETKVFSDSLSKADRIIFEQFGPYMLTLDNIKEKLEGLNPQALAVLKGVIPEKPKFKKNKTVNAEITL